MAKNNAVNRRLEFCRVLLNAHKRFLFLIVGLLICYLFKRELVLVIIFAFLDFSKNILKVKFGIFPVDIAFVFGVTAAYFYNPIYGLIILAIATFNRAAFGFIESRHFFSSAREMMLFMLILLLKNINFTTVCMIMLTLKYVAHYTSDLLFLQRITFERTHFFIANIIGSMFLFYIINELSFLL
ncbi:MAG: hypothetical protein V1859_07405 [archaeon]